MTQQVPDSGSCTCEKCLACCKHYPGWMTPEEASRAIAAGRGKDLMSDYFTPDSRYGNEDEILVLCPASMGYEGQRAPGDPSNIPCTFLVNNKCSIHDTDFKPKQCRETFGCKAQGPDKIDMVGLWDTDQGRAVVEQWTRIVFEGDPA